MERGQIAFWVGFVVGIPLALYVGILFARRAKKEAKKSKKGAK